MKKVVVVLFMALSMSSLAHADLSCEANLGGVKQELKNISPEVVQDQVGEYSLIITSWTLDVVDVSIFQKDGTSISFNGIVPFQGFVRFYLGNTVSSAPEISIFCYRD